jgi:hypothetical protein
MSKSREANVMAMDPKTQTIVIPTTMTVLEKDSFPNAESIKTVKFAAGSQVRRLEAGTFGLCTSLQSIVIPASVEFLGKNCFINSNGDRYGSARLQIIGFDFGSTLREIESGAFSGCYSLVEICIPRSVEKMNAESLPPSSACQIHLERGNRYFNLSRGFLIDLNQKNALRYLGRASEVRIPDGVVKIDESCFYCGTPICSITFPSNSRLSSMETRPFAYRPDLITISIPSRVTCLGDFCFDCCSSLKTVSFHSCSKLTSMPNGAFYFCSSLKSIFLPLTVKTVGVLCFGNCQALEHGPFQRTSQIVRIEHRAFGNCRSLKSMFLPASIQFVGERCFEGCNSLSRLMFASPSHLRELRDFPSSLSGSFAMPDSVEIIWLLPARNSPCKQHFIFGIESRLSQIMATSARRFLSLSNRSLKAFRTNLEFERGCEARIET